MANPTLPGVSPAEQALLYSKLNAYNEGRASYKEAGVYLVVLPRPGHPAYSLWIYSPLPERQAIFYLCELSADINEALRILDFSQHARFLAYELLPERCFNEPEVIKAAAQKLYDGIERAKELLAILEKHYGEVEKKPRGGSFSCCDPCVCESAAPCSPRRPQ